MSLGLGTTLAAPIVGSSATVGISWTAPASGGPTYDGYNIYKSTDGGTNYSLLDTAASGATSASVEASAGDKLKIVAYNDAGESDDSNVLTVT